MGQSQSVYSLCFTITSHKAYQRLIWLLLPTLTTLPLLNTCTESPSIMLLPIAVQQLQIFITYRRIGSAIPLALWDSLLTLPTRHALLVILHVEHVLRHILLINVLHVTVITESTI